MENLFDVYNLLDNINNSAIKPAAVENGVTKAINNYLLTDPRGIQLVSLLYSGMDLTRALTDLNSFILTLQNKVITDSSVKVELSQGLSPINEDELVENECDFFAELPMTLCLCSAENVKTSSVNPDKYNWYSYEGKKAKQFNFRENAYVIEPKSIVGFSIAKIDGKTSCIVSNNNKSFRVVSADFTPLKNCCKKIKEQASVYETISGGMKREDFDKLSQPEKDNYIKKHPTSTYAEKKANENKKDKKFDDMLEIVVPFDIAYWLQYGDEVEISDEEKRKAQRYEKMGDIYFKNDELCDEMTEDFGFADKATTIMIDRHK